MPVLSKRTTGINELNERYDFHPTQPEFVHVLLQEVDFRGGIWEPACGNGAMSKILEERFGAIRVRSSDIYNHGYGLIGVDFLAEMEPVDNIVTNPPFTLATEFVEKALSLARHKVAMLIKINFAWGIDRYGRIFVVNPPNLVLVLPRRMRNMHTGGHYSFDHAWFVWDQKEIGPTEMRWVDPGALEDAIR